MAHVERVPVTRLVTIGGYVTSWSLEEIIRDLDDTISDDYHDQRGKIKVTIEFIEDNDD